MSELDQWWVVVACMGLFGMGLGTLYVLDVLIVVRVLGVQRLSSVFGLSHFFRCVVFFILGPVGGKTIIVFGPQEKNMYTRLTNDTNILTFF